MLELTFHSDPGHAWLEVDQDLVFDLGIEVSIYSYKKGTTLFLEEDCDAPKLLDALKSEGTEFKILEVHTDKDSPIRNYNRA